MMNPNYFRNALLIAATGLLLFQCKSSKKKPIATPSGEVEIVLPCSGSEFFTSATVFRANSVGESKGQVVSKRMALSNARAELAASIETTVKSVTDNYFSSRTYDNREELRERYEGLNREVVNQQLNGIRTICERLTRTQEGTYKTYIAIELDTEGLMKAFNDRLSRDEMLRIDYDYERFKNTFEEEMKKFEKRR
jgi:hypothetical protein